MKSLLGLLGRCWLTLALLESNDVSYRKICVLTTSRKKLNEEVMVSMDGILHKFGVFEVDDEWFPFKQINLGSPSDS